MQLSVTIITYNEERNLRRCLESVQQVADEIIVLDSGSTDHTYSIASEFGAKWYIQPFLGHIEQKNKAVSLAKHDWILSLDADESLSAELKTNILNIKNQEISKHTAFRVNRRNIYCGEPIHHCGWYPDRKIRLWHQQMGSWGGLNPHDKVVVSTDVKIVHLDGDLMHYSYATVKEHEAKSRRYAQISAEAKHRIGKNATALHPYFAAAWKYVQVLFFQLGVLDGRRGWQIARICAYEKYLKYKILHELR